MQRHCNVGVDGWGYVNGRSQKNSESVWEGVKPTLKTSDLELYTVWPKPSVGRAGPTWPRGHLQVEKDCSVIASHVLHCYLWIVVEGMT